MDTTRDSRRIPISGYAAEMMGVRNETGWIGTFSRGEAPGAIKNGKPVVKTASEGGDRNPVGTKGTVLGSIRHPQHGIAYWVEWDNHPRHAIFVVEEKISEAS